MSALIFVRRDNICCARRTASKLDDNGASVEFCLADPPRRLSLRAGASTRTRTDVSPSSAFELASQQANVGVELGVAGAQLLDLTNRVNDRRMVAAAEAAADIGQRLGRQLL